MAREDIDIQDEIDQYVNGLMSGERLEAFEQKLANDPVLGERVERFQRIVFGLEGVNIKDQLREIHIERSGLHQRRSLRWILPIAASILLLLTFWIVDPFEEDNKAVFNEYFKPFPDLISVRNTNDNLLDQGMKLYVAGKYEQAIGFLGQKADSGDNEVHRRFYLGICYLATDRSKEAIQVFSELQGVDHVYTQQVRWYLGLSHWQSGNIDEAKRVLQQIQAGEYEYQNAREILGL